MGARFGFRLHAILDALLEPVIAATATASADRAALARVAAWAARATPAGTEPSSMDALDKATEIAAAALDARGVPFLWADLQDAINEAQA